MILVSGMCKVHVSEQNRGRRRWTRQVHFDRNHVDYLGYIVSLKGISVVPLKVLTVQERENATFYRKYAIFLDMQTFIVNLSNNYLKIVMFLNKLIV